MSVERFIDTTISCATAERIVRNGLAVRDACVGVQIVRQRLNVARREAAKPLSAEAAGAYLEAVLRPPHPPAAPMAPCRRAIDVRVRRRFNGHDALIVEAALPAGCSGWRPAG